MEKNDKVVVAKIVNVHGIQGQVKVKSYCDNLPDFKSYGELSFASGEVVKVKKIGGWKKDVTICTLEGVSDRNAAELLKGKELFVNSDAFSLASKEDDEFFIQDLRDCTVVIDDALFGIVHDVQDFGAGDLIEILPEGENNLRKTLLVPFIDEAVLDVDIENKKIIISADYIVR